MVTLTEISNTIRRHYEALHDAGVLHNNVGWPHILCHPSHCAIRIVDFSRAVARSDETDPEWDHRCASELEELDLLLASGAFPARRACLPAVSVAAPPASVAVPPASVTVRSASVVLPPPTFTFPTPAVAYSASAPAYLGEGTVNPAETSVFPSGGDPFADADE